MKTAAIIASLTVVGSIAYATGSQGGSGKQPPLMPSGSQAHSMQEEMPQARMQMAGGCTEGADKNWFTILHPWTSSCGVGAELPGVNDVNGDGIKEYFWVSDFVDRGGMIIQNGQPSPTCLLYLSEVSGIGDDWSNEPSCALRSDYLYVDVLARFPDANTASAYRTHLRDMDGDGDLDVLTDIVVQGPNGAVVGDYLVWIENTGFQHTNHIAADLNHDNRVDGADLSLLLYAWGQTQ